VKPDPATTTAAAELRRRAEARLKDQKSAASGQRSVAENERLLHELQVHQIELEMQNEELRDSQLEVEAGLARYTDLYDFAPVSYATLDRNGVITRTNLACTRLLGLERARLTGKRFAAFVAEADRPTFNIFLQQIFAAQARQTCEVELVGKDPPQRTVRIEGDLSANGQECRIVAVDITERKQSEAAQARLAAIVESSDEAIISKNLNGIIITWNHGAEKLFGYAAAEIIGQSVTRLFPPEKLGEELEILAQIKAGKTVDHFETMRMAKDGRHIEVSVTISPIHGSTDQIIGASKIVRDITARKRAEKALRQSSRFAQATLDALPANIAILDDSGTIIAVNKAWRDFAAANPPLRGNACEGANYLAVCDAVVGDESSAAVTLAEAIRAVSRGDLKSFAYEYPCHSPKKKRWFAESVTRFPGEGPVRLVVTHFDITDRKLAEERLAGIINSSMDGIVTIDEAQRIVLFNATAQKMFGYKEPEVLGRSLDILIPERFRPDHLKNVCELNFMGATTRLMGQFGYIIGLKSNGEEFPVEASFSRLEHRSRTIYTATLRDITERKRMENQLQQASRFEAFGLLVGGVAHDFNNLLTVINGHCQLLMQHNLDENILQGLRLINKTGERAAKLTRQLLAFSRQQPMQPGILDLNAITLEMEMMLQRLLPENISFETTLAPSLGAVLADPGQIEQVILNLVVNARDAMPNGGTLAIETCNVELSDEHVRNYCDVMPGRYVMLSVSDTGVGMDETVKARIFEPFFTTKEVGKGTGLGLATVFGIVKQNKGHIDVYSKVNHGTTFKVYLQLSNEKISSPISSNALPAIARGKETLLLVEDDDAVRELTREILEQHGYNIITAGNGVDALKIIENSRGRIALLITDGVMPKMNGIELSERVQSLFPAIKTILMSGYSNIDQEKLSGCKIFFVQKPFSASALVRKIGEILDAQNKSS